MQEKLDAAGLAALPFVNSKMCDGVIIVYFAIYSIFMQ